jgi:hypothetical protein
VIAPSKTFPSGIDCFALVKSQNSINTSLQQEGDVSERAKSTVGQSNIATDKRTPHFPEQKALALFKRSDFYVKNGGGQQRKYHHQPCNGKSTSELLLRGLRVFFLVGTGIRHGNASAVNHFHSAAAPQLTAPGTRLHPLSHTPENVTDDSFGKAFARFAKGTGVVRRKFFRFAGAKHRQNTADGWTAGMIGPQNLGQKGVERNDRRVNAFVIFGTYRCQGRVNVRGFHQATKRVNQLPGKFFLQKPRKLTDNIMGHCLPPFCKNGLATTFIGRRRLFL